MTCWEASLRMNADFAYSCTYSGIKDSKKAKAAADDHFDNDN